MNTKTLSREKMIEGAKLSAKVEGCTCDPDVRLRELRPLVFSAEVAHERGCRHPSQLRHGSKS